MKITVAARIKRMPISNLEKIRLVLAFLRESPMESDADLSVFNLEFARLGRLTLVSCFKLIYLQTYSYIITHLLF